LFSLIYPVVFAQHAQPLNRLRQRYGLTPLGGLQNVYTHGDYTLYADIPSLVQTRHLPPNHSYLGPLLWSPPVAHPEWWDSLPKNCPHIYITLGSSGQSEILPLIIEAIANLPVVAMVATAGRKDIADVPGKVWGANFLPGMEAARRSALVICNGGSATVYQALSAGVPVLGVASNMDQYLTMKCVCEAGAGKLVRAGQATVAHLRKAITEMLFDESYRQCSKRLALECQQYNARERFAALVESWFK
jgi:UDP:flavonoid glycosyltransferase YjiC (YdhE family)